MKKKKVSSLCLDFHFVCCMRAEHDFMFQGFHFSSKNSMSNLTKLLHLGLWVLSPLLFHTFSVKSWVNMPFILSKDPFLVRISPQPYPLSRVSSTLGNQKRYLNEGVVPTTNEITFLCYSKSDSEEQQRHERHPDGQYICYLLAPILKEMNIVDTPGTNVILQRQQRLTEEFVPRADLLLFVFSADKPLTESELEEAILFIKENTRKLLNTDDVILYPISARSALEAKLSASSDTGKEYSELSVSESHLKITRFYELEQFLYRFLDASTTTGMERIRLTLETPIAIAERLLSACETLVNQDCHYAKQDLTSAT
ncbi:TRANSMEMBRANE GTPASE FZO [Salix viminalis]|uniref:TRANSMEMBRANE GTPASE FZO n=1 Tax=Salix viminalis TaxID=40686 RepID=A0A9Q0UJ51_SALVM|nr:TRANSMEMBRANE GTPASE FZO [Salix viminalis]